jgi:hypothetical protein
MSIRFHTLAARGPFLVTLAVLSIVLLATSLVVSERASVPLTIAGFVGLIALRFTARNSPLFRLRGRRFPDSMPH